MIIFTNAGKQQNPLACQLHQFSINLRLCQQHFLVYHMKKIPFDIYECALDVCLTQKPISKHSQHRNSKPIFWSFDIFRIQKIFCLFVFVWKFDSLYTEKIEIPELIEKKLDEFSREARKNRMFDEANALELWFLKFKNVSVFFSKNFFFQIVIQILLHQLIWVQQQHKRWVMNKLISLSFLVV